MGPCCIARPERQPKAEDWGAGERLCSALHGRGGTSACYYKLFPIQAPVAAAFNTQCCDMEGPDSFSDYDTSTGVWHPKTSAAHRYLLSGVCGAIGREKRGVDFRWRRNRVSIGSSNRAGTADLFEPCPRQLGNWAGLDCNRADGIRIDKRLYEMHKEEKLLFGAVSDGRSHGGAFSATSSAARRGCRALSHSPREVINPQKASPA